MGWEDRSYYRDRNGALGGHIEFLLNGSWPLFTVFGIRVRMHISLALFIAVTLLLGGIGSSSYNLQQRLLSMGVLFVIVLLHEFGHCFAARKVGGDADQIILSPLGGLAMANAPHRPLARFITVAGGPAVNVLICLVIGVVMFVSFHWLPWNPFGWLRQHPEAGFTSVHSYLVWIYSISLWLLLFNLLPIFPLDGGQMLQTILWPKFGYNRSMNFACITGMIGAVILGIVGLATSLLLTFIALSGFLTCMMMRRQLKEMGPEFEDGPDFSESLAPDPPVKRRRKVSRWKIRRLRRMAMQEELEQTRIDEILAKVSAQGMHSLTWSERRALRKATERQRQRDLELAKYK